VGSRPGHSVSSTFSSRGSISTAANASTAAVRGSTERQPA
jgi:hypothetical protein